MKEVKGNLITYAEYGNCDIIVHGCNCFCKMGAGIAKEIRHRYPDAYKVDCQTICGDITKLGNFSWVKVMCSRNGNKFVIVNAYTQYNYGRNKRHVDYDAVRRAFFGIANKFPHARIAYPLIGTGYGGGDWNVIKAAIEYELRHHNHTLIVL